MRCITPDEHHPHYSHIYKQVGRLITPHGSFLYIFAATKPVINATNEWMNAKPAKIHSKISNFWHISLPKSLMLLSRLFSPPSLPKTTLFKNAKQNEIPHATASWEFKFTVIFWCETCTIICCAHERTCRQFNSFIILHSWSCVESKCVRDGKGVIVTLVQSLPGHSSHSWQWAKRQISIITSCRSILK